MAVLLTQQSSTSSNPPSKELTASQASNPKVNPLNPTGIKPCCACPQTKSLRDDCFLLNDPSAAQENCREFIEKHRECMKGYGFKV